MSTERLDIDAIKARAEAAHSAPSLAAKHRAFRASADDVPALVAYVEQMQREFREFDRVRRIEYSQLEAERDAIQHRYDTDGQTYARVLAERDEARAELARVMPVVKAARAWVADKDTLGIPFEAALIAAVDAATPAGEVP